MLSIAQRLIDNDYYFSLPFLFSNSRAARPTALALFRPFPAALRSRQMWRWKAPPGSLPAPSFGRRHRNKKQKTKTNLTTTQHKKSSSTLLAKREFGGISVKAFTLTPGWWRWSPWKSKFCRSRKDFCEVSRTHHRGVMAETLPVFVARLPVWPRDCLPAPSLPAPGSSCITTWQTRS